MKRMTSAKTRFKGRMDVFAAVFVTIATSTSSAFD